MNDFYIDILRDNLFRKTYGAHFTSAEIVSRICTNVTTLIGDKPINWKTFKFLDLASGTGVFSYYMSFILSKKFGRSFTDIINNNCIMVELDQTFSDKSRLIFESLGCDPVIFTGDALFDDRISNLYFDVVLSNPPYIRIQNIPMEYRDVLRGKYKSCTFGSADIYYAFMEYALNHLKDGGVMGFITPSSYLRTESGRYIREMLSNHVYQVEDLGSTKVFDCDTYTALTFAIKNNDKKIFSYSSDTKNLMLPKSSLNVSKFIPTVGNTLVFLKDICKMRGGIATLRDAVFVVKPQKMDKHLIYLDGGASLELESTQNLIKISELKSSGSIIPNKYRCVFPYNGNLKSFKKFEDETMFSRKFPNTFAYLLYNKEELLKRDRGILKGYRWFEFGRIQGLVEYGPDCIVTSSMNEKPLFIRADLSNSLVRSGIVLFDICYDLDKLLKKLNSNKMFEFIYENGSKYGDNWRGYNKKTLENFPLD